MRVSLAAAVLVSLVLAGNTSYAQTAQPEIARSHALIEEQAAIAPATARPDAIASEQPAIAERGLTPSGQSFFGSVGSDFKNFFTSRDTIRTVGMLGAGALIASRWDSEATRSAHANLPDEAFGPGKLGGNFLVHVAAGGATYLAGRVSGHGEIASVGSSLIRAQLLSQTVVQAAKYATHRGRPDGSNSHSLPSGHTASAFATAGVLHRHLGWKIGIPAYAFAGYIGASRLSANRHYLSDVLIGAGIGLASAHAVTLHVGRKDFAVGVSPTNGGAMLTFTKR